MADPRVGLVPAGPCDLDPLLAMMERFYATERYAFDPHVARAALGELLAKPELGRAWRIARGAETLGYAVLTFGWSLEWGGRDAFVDEIFIEAPERGRGAGRSALRALVEEARRLGVRALHLEVEVGNEAGQALYRSEGFRGNERRILTRRLDG